MPKLWRKGDLIRTEFAHWPIDRQGTEQEIDVIGTCMKYESNLFQYFVQEGTVGTTKTYIVLSRFPCGKIDSGFVNIDYHVT